MGMKDCEGKLRVSVDVYLYSCCELECLHEGDEEFSFLCRSSNQQQVGLNN
jgi:hypothetical protein